MGNYIIDFAKKERITQYFLIPQQLFLIMDILKSQLSMFLYFCVVSVTQHSYNKL
ncbi:hypothetical protein pb186bvf_002656 [Paramecium bursaria]